MTPPQSPITREGERRPRKRLEEELQTSLVKHLAWAAPKAMYFAVPNGEHRSKATGARLKAQGVRAGVADLCFILKGGYAAFMELKRPGGKQSPKQIQFASWCEANEVPYALVSNMDVAIEVLKGWEVVR